MRRLRLSLPATPRHRLALFACAALLLCVMTWLLYEQLSGKDDEAATPPPPPITLLAPFESFLSVAEVTHILEKQSLRLEVEHLEVPILNGRMRVLDTVTTYGFKHLGEAGRLTLEFVDNRLYECSFRPDRLGPYATALRRQMGLRPDPRQNARTEVIQGRLRIFTNVFNANTAVGRKLGTEGYILWQDSHLVAERRQQ